MAKKKVLTVVKIQIEAGKASPAPPVGTALGPHGIAIMDFVKAYNAQTEAQAGTVVPTEITIYEDRTFDFVLKTPPTAVLIREKAGLSKAANNPGAEVAGSKWCDTRLSNLGGTDCGCRCERVSPEESPRTRGTPGRRRLGADMARTLLCDAPS